MDNVQIIEYARSEGAPLVGSAPNEGSEHEGINACLLKALGTGRIASAYCL